MEQLELQFEQWKDIPGYEGIYQVSDQGRIRGLTIGGHGRHKPNRIKKAFPGKDGYYRIQLVRNRIGKTFLFHRLVMLAFVGKPPVGKEVNHINGCRSDNRLENLEYVTRSENIIHARDVLRTVKLGEENHFAKLKAEDIPKIRALSNSGIRIAEIARRFGVTDSTISAIIQGKTWRHV